jgi:hypothetical protein
MDMGDTCCRGKNCCTNDDEAGQAEQAERKRCCCCCRPGCWKKARWSDLDAAHKAGVILLAAVELSLAVAAWADLAKRPAAQINGAKVKWAAVIGVNFIGPICYFRNGRKPAA